MSAQPAYQDPTYDPDERIEADRDIPSVARRGTGQMVMAGIFFTVCALAAGYVVYDGLYKSDDPSFLEADAAAFEVNRGSAGSAYVQPEFPTTPPPPGSQAPIVTAAGPAPEDDYDPLAAQRQAALEAEALRLAREQAARLQERMRSPQLVLGGSGTTAPAQTAVALQGGQTDANGALLRESPGSGNANQRFLDQTARLEVETARATQLSNLDALVPQGTLIAGVLESAIQSDLPGQVRAVVSEDTYSMDQSRLLIPRGSRLIGRYRAGLVQGQTRVFVVWERLLRSDGVSIQVGSVGTDQLGRSGVEGEVDTHFFERFGTAILLSLIDGGIAAGIEAIDDDSATSVAVDTGSGFTRSAEIALENSINIPPTIHVNQGTRIKVFVGRDLDFSQVVN